MNIKSLPWYELSFSIYFPLETKASITAAKTETKQAEMKLKHSKEELKNKQQEMKRTASDYAKDKSLLERMEKEVKNLEVSWPLKITLTFFNHFTWMRARQKHMELLCELSLIWTDNFVIVIVFWRWYLRPKCWYFRLSFRNWIMMMAKWRN